jgi:hypothetical protein
MSTSILENAKEKITRFNNEGLHYNLVANEIYKMRNGIIDPFDKSFLKYLIAGLTVFDLGRMMGSKKYDFKDGFASRLDSKLQEIKRLTEPLMKLSLASIDLQEHRDVIKKAYETLSVKGPGALYNEQKSFYVGATKILHFLNPELFIIVDSNAARAFHDSWGLPFRNATQPGYSAELYFECMKCAKTDILEHGLERFRALDKPDVPLTRIYDKLTFVTGSRD